eukprot:c10358_g1_i2.p1 GENE.c10358_g1_i2~~c10358_g1_i2.p1  ORF type:complete len:251 (-),score=61.59 c10358_g1_i2:185-883(-)
MDEHIVAQVGGVDITAQQAMNIMGNFISTPLEQKKAPSSSGPARTIFEKVKKVASSTVGLLSETFSLEYRPWTQFFNPSKFRKPQDHSMALRDTLLNLRYWLYNYLVLSLVVFVYCLLTNPVLILCFLASGGCWVWLTMIRKHPVVILGKTLNQQQLLYMLMGFSATAFILTSGYKTLVWSMIFSSILSVTHAVFREPEGVEYTRVPVTEHDAMELEIRAELSAQGQTDFDP